MNDSLLFYRIVFISLILLLWLWLAYKIGRDAGRRDTILADEQEECEVLTTAAVDVKRTGGPGVGMPAALFLDEFGSQVWSAFGRPPYLVGSALHGKGWRDVDVRLILPDEEYEHLGLGHPDRPHKSPKWVSLVMAYSALGRAMTGLPVDFQIQQQTAANEGHDGPRSALGLVGLRSKDPPSKED